MVFFIFRLLLRVYPVSLKIKLNKFSKISIILRAVARILLVQSAPEDPLSSWHTQMFVIIIWIFPSFIFFQTMLISPVHFIYPHWPGMGYNDVIVRKYLLYLMFAGLKVVKLKCVQCKNTGFSLCNIHYLLFFKILQYVNC